MAKTVVIDPEEGTRAPFLRGILTRSLQDSGLAFDDAYKLASRVRQDLASIPEITAGELRTLKREHPQATVLCYVNTTAEVKAECDLCCTSANALSMVQGLLAREKEIIFVPDRNLARYVEEQTGRDNILAWDGYCYVHDDMVLDELARAKRRAEKRRKWH